MTTYTPAEIGGGRGYNGVGKFGIHPQGNIAQAIIMVWEDGKQVEKRAIVEDWPKNMTPGEWYISLSGDNRKVESFWPKEATLICKLSHFTKQENQQPSPRLRSSQYGDYLQFSLFHEVVMPDNPLNGIKVLDTYRYLFVENPNDHSTAYKGVVNSPRAVHLPKLHNFLMAAGAWEEGAIPWSENILPELEARILRSNKTYQVEISRGWVTSVTEISTLEMDWSEVDPGTEEVPFTPDEPEDAPHKAPVNDSEFDF